MTLTTRLALAMILLVAIAVSAVGWLSYRNLEQEVLPRVLDRSEAHARLIAFDLETHVRGPRADIAGLHSATALNGFIRARTAGGVDPIDGLSERSWHDRQVERMVADLETKPAYAQFRIIGAEDGGRELMRVDRSGPNGTIRVVPDAELQQKGDLPYFKETIDLPPGTIYVSSLDLNQEHGTIERPFVPTLRIATPLQRPGGKPFGIAVVNVDMRPAFDHVRSSARPGGAIYVVGKRGEYFVHPDRTREFGADPGQPMDWRKDFPDIAPLLGSSGSTARTMRNSKGRQDGVAIAPAILAGSEWVGIIETVPNAILMGPSIQVRNTALKVGAIAVLCAAVLALLIARSLTRPITQLTKAVEGIGQGGTAAIPVEATGETGVLARAFARMIAESSEKTLALEREVAEHRRTEAARDHHAERERLFSAAVESSNDGIITMSLDGTVTGWNAAAERLYGYTAEEAVGKNINVIIPAERQLEVEDTLRRIGWGEKIEHNETVRRRKDGSLVEVSLSISPIKAPSGATIGISKVARDITETNRARLALRQQTEERRRIFETSQDLILVMNSRGFLVQISPSCQTILGYRPDEMIGRSGEDFIHPDDLEMSRAEMRAARRGQRNRISDTRVFHKDGHAVPLSWLGTWSDPVKRFFFVGRDMTESRRTQEALREREQLANGIIDTALDAFIQVDQRGVIRNWNSQAEAIFGWKRQEAIGKNVFRLAAPDPKQGPLQLDLKRFLGSGEVQVLRRRREIVAKRRNGQEFTAELSITALKTRDGFLFNGFLRDLTEKIAAEDRIRHAEKMEAIGQLTGGIAHDFNNILTVITGTIEILAEAVADKPPLSAIARMIDDAASRGAELTQHLLAFARKQPLQPREVDINTLIIDTAKLLRPTLGEQIEIESVFDDDTCVAHVDPNQLTTAVLNLALNARDAMPRGGKLILETGFAALDDAYADSNDVRPGRYAMIAVSDTGVGIHADMLDKVFDPFVTSKGPGKGTGLGLSMVYGFVKQSSGHIKIYSEAGHGTTIKMYLPPGTGAAVATELPAPALQGGNETILVVEDDRLVREYVLAQLHSLGYVTLDAANATEALALVTAGNHFDLLFTDIIMPGTMNGRQLADEIEKHRPGSRVLYTSGYTENAIIHHGRLDTGVLLLAKPYRKSDLAGMIRKALGD